MSVTRRRPAQGTRDILKPFAKAYAAIERDVLALSDEDLARLTEGVPDFTTTNCWWAEYDTIRLIAPIVQREIRQRQA